MAVEAGVGKGQVMRRSWNVTKGLFWLGLNKMLYAWICRQADTCRILQWYCVCHYCPVNTA